MRLTWLALVLLLLNPKSQVKAATYRYANSTLEIMSANAIDQIALGLLFDNNLSSERINVYVTGLDTNNEAVLLQPDGTFFHPSADSDGSVQPITQDVAIPIGGQGTTTAINVLDYISSARIWVSDGELQFFSVLDPTTMVSSIVSPSQVSPQDPSAGVSWGLVEFTVTEAGIIADLSYVDFVGLILGLTLVTSSGSKQTAKGLQADAASVLCDRLGSQAASDGQPWDRLCISGTDGTLLRVLSPADYISINSSAFSGYYSSYTEQVWSRYTAAALTIDTQSSDGLVDCQVVDGILNCEGDSRGFKMPVEADIFGCNSGPFAIESDDTSVHKEVVPRLCAAFVRSTLLLGGGNVQPSLSSSDYYTVEPTDFYSSHVHDLAIDGLGYSFPYDDVGAEGEDSSGRLADPSPKQLIITIGGPS